MDTDPHASIYEPLNGIGRAKGFGCGMMVKRI